MTSLKMTSRHFGLALTTRPQQIGYGIFIAMIHFITCGNLILQNLKKD